MGVLKTSVSQGQALFIFFFFFFSLFFFFSFSFPAFCLMTACTQTYFWAGKGLSRLYSLCTKGMWSCHKRFDLSDGIGGLLTMDLWSIHNTKWARERAKAWGGGGGVEGWRGREREGVRERGKERGGRDGGGGREKGWRDRQTDKQTDRDENQMLRQSSSVGNIRALLTVQSTHCDVNWTKSSCSQQMGATFTGWVHSSSRVL